MNIRGLHNYIEGRESFKCSVCGEFYDVDKRFFPVCCPYCGYGRNSSLLLDATVERALQNIEISILKRIDTQIEICKEMIKRDMLEFVKEQMEIAKHGLAEHGRELTYEIQGNAIKWQVGNAQYEDTIEGIYKGIREDYASNGAKPYKIY